MGIKYRERMLWGKEFYVEHVLLVINVMFSDNLLLINETLNTTFSMHVDKFNIFFLHKKLNILDAESCIRGNKYHLDSL